jgi:SAM-dependent methyltransferase
LWLAAGPAEAREVRLHFAIRLERIKGGIEDGSRSRIFRALDSVVHPLSLSPGSHDPSFFEVGEMAGDFGLALAKDFDQIADAHFAACDEIEEAQPGAVGESREEWNQVRGGSAGGHGSIIYGLTDMSRRDIFALTNTRRVLMNGPSEVKEEVKLKYGSAARSVAETGSLAACCDPALRCCDPITANLYSSDEKGQIPERAVLASLGCGNPTALIDLKPGEVVLDLGSGGGIDVLLSARRVGATGKAYGLDMTDEMLALARENQRQAGVENVEFLKGEIEHIPLADNTVDVVISNCVINLSADKDQVLREAFRVLKPGGRFAVSDVVVRGEVPEQVRQSMLLWVGCVAGALEEQDYRKRLEAAGFCGVNFEPTRVYDIEDARQFLSGSGVDVDAIAAQTQGKLMSAFIRGTKPAAIAEGSCCGSGCCSTGVETGRA